MLKTTIKLLTFFLALFIGLFAAFVWIRNSQESCGFLPTKADSVDKFAPVVKSEPADDTRRSISESARLFNLQIQCRRTRIT